LPGIQEPRIHRKVALDSPARAAAAQTDEEEDGAAAGR
jgi:hypothetical protein